MEKDDKIKIKGYGVVSKDKLPILVKGWMKTIDTQFKKENWGGMNTIFRNTPFLEVLNVLEKEQE